jgi:hypothetical protein
MSEFDNHLGRALNGDAQPDPGKIDEMREKAANVFKQRLWMAGYLYTIFMVFCMVVIVFASLQFGRAMDVKEMILFAVLLLAMFEGTVLMKLWYWGLHSHINTMREIKRLQFRVEDLAMNRASESPCDALSDLGDFEKSLPLGRFGKPYAAVTTLLLLVASCVIFAPVIRSGALSSGFAGRQADEWHVVSPELIEAHSELTVTSWPGDPDTMKIALPYKSGELQSVTCAGEDVAFQKLGREKYELDLPSNWLALQDKTFKAIWKLPIDSLDRDSSMYRADLKTLIPSHGYSLKFVLEDECGFQFSRDPSAGEMQPFSGSGKYPFLTNYGSCGTMLVKKR